MPTSDERLFSTFRRGQVRDDVLLAAFRDALRNLVNPDTGLVFTEDEIAAATQPGTRFYIEADSIDLQTQAYQARSLFLSDQLRPTRSNTDFLDNVHGRLWLGLNSRLEAVGASGTVTAVGTVGSIFPGSTTLGNPAAATATDANGSVFQVLETTVVPTGGSVVLSIQGVTTGTTTNLSADALLTWSTNQPLGAEPTCTVDDAGSGVGLSGGFEIENDSEYGERIEDRIRFRPASGNSAHFNLWARQASVAVETAFVYPTALNAGSVMVCVTEKRSTTTLDGPERRVDPSVGTMTDVTNYLVPPDSPVTPQHVFVLVVSANGQESDLVVRLSMGYGTSGGWNDSTPWPNPDDDSSYLETVVATAPTTTQFTVTTDSDLPGGASSLTGDDAPQLMVWIEESSRYERLTVSSVEKSGTIATITLGDPPDHTIVAGDRISPYTDQMDTVAEAVEDYFDELGPGELYDLDTDPRGARGYRWPPPAVRYPQRAGQAVISRLIDALSGVSPDASLIYISRNEPDVPSYPSDGPNQVILGQLTVLPL